MKKILTVLLLMILFINNNFSQIYSISTGNWLSNSTWKNGTIPTKFDNVVIKNNHAITISINDSITISDLWLGNNSILIIEGLLIIDSLHINNNSILNVSGSLFIIGGVSMSNNTLLTVNNVGNVFVGGDFDTGNGSILNIDGNLKINGDLTGNAALIGNGEVIVNGTVDETITDSNNILPIELLYFDGWRVNDEIILEWVTLSEDNNDYFIIEYTDNLIDWSKAKWIINGNGTTNNRHSYRLSIIANSSYIFRLSQVDYNGTKTVYDDRLVSILAGNNKNLEYYTINGLYLGKYDKPPTNTTGLFIIGDGDIKKIQFIKGN